MDAFLKISPNLFVEAVGKLTGRALQRFTPTFTAEGTAGYTNHSRILRQVAFLVQRIKCGDKLATRQVTGRTKYDDRVNHRSRRLLFRLKCNRCKIREYEIREYEAGATCSLSGIPLNDPS